MKGRHVRPGPSSFARDLTVMLLGIVVVGAIVFGGLWIISGDDPEVSASEDTTTTTTSSSTTTTSSTTSTATSSTTTTTTTTTSVPEEARPPEEVTVLVLNAAGVQGLAGRVNEELAGLGYQTLTPGNYQPSLDVSQVWYQEGFGPEALELGASFPDAGIEPLGGRVETEADIVVVLGASYQG